MTLPSFELDRPASLAEALRGRSEDRVALAGGTELLLAMRMGLLAPAALIDIKRLPELRQIDASHDGELWIGAAVTHDEVAGSAAVARDFPMLQQVAEHVGNPRVRVQGTIGGNIVFAEPKSDVIAALVVLDAKVDLASPDAERSMLLEDFVLGPYWTDIADEELLVRIRLPETPGRRSTYRKFQTMERPTVGVALRRDADGRGRVVISAVCGEPFIHDVSDLDDLDPEGIAGEIDVVADLTGGEAYKRHLTAVMIRRVVAELRASEDSHEQ